MKLNLGCGRNILKGWINLDISKEVKPDVCHNLNEFPYPFKDNKFDYIFADNVLEHLDNLIPTLEELSRITKESGTIEIIVPLAPTMHSFRDPTHKLFFTYRTFEYFLKDSGFDYYSSAKFEIIERDIIFHNRLIILTKLINLNSLVKKLLCEFFSQFFPPAFLKIKLRVTK